MTINQSRSLNGDLHEGMTEGTYRRKAKNRGGLIEDTYLRARAGLHPDWNYDLITEETPAMELPDGSGHC